MLQTIMMQMYSNNGDDYDYVDGGVSVLLLLKIEISSRRITDRL